LRPVPPPKEADEVRHADRPLARPQGRGDPAVRVLREGPAAACGSL